MMRNPFQKAVWLRLLLVVFALIVYAAPVSAVYGTRRRCARRTAIVVTHEEKSAAQKQSAAAQQQTAAAQQQAAAETAAAQSAAAAANASAASAAAASQAAAAASAAAAANANAPAANTNATPSNTSYTMGSVHAALPAGCISPNVSGGGTYYLCDNIWFQPTTGANGVVSYKVVPTP